MKKFYAIALLTLSFLGLNTQLNTADAQIIFISQYIDGNNYADTSNATFVKDDKFATVAKSNDIPEGLEEVKRLNNSKRLPTLHLDK